MLSKMLASKIFDDYIYPAIISITFVLACFYLSDIFSNIYAGIGTALLVICLLAAAIECMKGE